MRQIAITGFLALAACSVPPVSSSASPSPDSASPAPAPLPQQPEPTRVLSQRDADRLLGNTGLTLQWISWDYRGQVAISEDRRGIYTIDGEQRGEDGALVRVQGTIAEIGADYFILDGTITIENTPDAGRRCQQTKPWRFAITQNRQYYRLREFEWCDRLTDYVDIYF